LREFGSRARHKLYGLSYIALKLFLVGQVRGLFSLQGASTVNQAGYRVVLMDASLIDFEEIKSEISPAQIEVVRPGNDTESHNELATILLIALTASAMSGFTLWLLRKHGSEVIDYKIKVRNPDGWETEVELKIRRSSSEAPEAQVIKQIAAALRLPEAAIVGASH
jgi:hypothetical protein